mgnify:CR=1 FL=1
MFYDRFHDICREKNVTPSQVAKALGINRSTLSMWKTKGVIPNAVTIINISRYLNTTPAYLMGNDMAKDAPFLDQKEKPDGSQTTIRPEEMQLIEEFRKLSPEMQDFILSSVRTQAEKLKNEHE